nr:hypothetical protein LKV13_04945 [Borrelia sp. BU AG58]
MRRIIIIAFPVLALALIITACGQDWTCDGVEKYKHGRHKNKYKKCKYDKCKYDKHKHGKHKHGKHKYDKLKYEKYKYDRYKYDECDYNLCDESSGNCKNVTALKIRRDEYISAVIDVNIKLEILVTNNGVPVHTNEVVGTSKVRDIQEMLADLDNTTTRILGDHLTDENLERIENDEEKLKQVAVELDKFITSRDTFVESLKRSINEGAPKVDAAEQYHSAVEAIKANESNLADLVKQ